MDRSNNRLPIAIGAALLLAALGFFGWQHFRAVEPTGLAVAVDAPAAIAPPVAMAPEPAAPEVAEPPAVENPIEIADTEETAATTASLPALSDSDAQLTEQLTSLMGRTGVLSFLQLDGFVRRVVATVDNLARSQASSKLWPVTPTPQRFTTLKNIDGTETVSPGNGERYTPLVRLIESVDPDQAVAVYRGLYPLFQQAYEELGFPNGYFNDRLVQVLDHLIATPLPQGPLAVKLLEVKGSVPSLRPWVRYEFVDPELEAMSAGRKILLRSGPDNQRRLITQLKALRQRVAKPI